MTPEREEELRRDTADRFAAFTRYDVGEVFAALDAERAAHAETRQRALELARLLEEANREVVFVKASCDRMQATIDLLYAPR